MADAATPKPKRIFRIVLVVSLALNLAFLGLVGGAIARSKAGGGPPRGIELGMGPLGRALSAEDRREVGRSIRDRTGFERGNRAEPRRTIQDIQTLLREDEFDSPALQEVLERSNRRASELQSAAMQALMDRINAMTPADRAEFADRLQQTSRRH